MLAKKMFYISRNLTHLTCFTHLRDLRLMIKLNKNCKVGPQGLIAVQFHKAGKQKIPLDEILCLA